MICIFANNQIFIEHSPTNGLQFTEIHFVIDSLCEEDLSPAWTGLLFPAQSNCSCGRL